MASFKIAQNPTFKANVEMPRVGGSPVAIEFEFKYRNRNELAEMFDKWNAARYELTKKSKDEGLSWKEVTAAEIALQVDQVKDVVAGWGYDEQFTDEAVDELVTTCVGAPQAVLDAYQKAYEPARRGN